MCTSGLNASSEPYVSPEKRIADIIGLESRVWIEPAVLRLIIKYRWAEIAKAAHEIHGSAH